MASLPREADQIGKNGKSEDRQDEAKKGARVGSAFLGRQLTNVCAQFGTRPSRCIDTEGYGMSLLLEGC